MTDESPAPKPPGRLTLAQILEWVTDPRTTDAERQAAKCKIQQFQADKFGPVGANAVRMNAGKGKA